METESRSSAGGASALKPWAVSPYSRTKTVKNDLWPQRSWLSLPGSSGSGKSSPPLRLTALSFQKERLLDSPTALWFWNFQTLSFMEKWWQQPGTLGQMGSKSWQGTQLRTTWLPSSVNIARTLLRMLGFPFQCAGWGYLVLDEWNWPCDIQWWGT